MPPLKFGPERVQRNTPLNHFAEDRQLAEMRAANSQLLIRSGTLGFIAGGALLQNVDEMTA
jgi:hypothetical protein